MNAAPAYFATPAVMTSEAPRIITVADRRYQRDRQLRQRDYGYNNNQVYNSRDYGYNNSGYNNYGYNNGDYGDYGPTRPAQKSAVIIGGSTAAGLRSVRWPAAEKVLRSVR